jgi:competence ComEA-like helix-hairpin-helix protein
MARISLRAYNRDIEAMIDGGQIEQALAHCRYILERYPKHIDTYRLMGKALLEAQRFGDAADLFHRVLSSIPDDFIAHLGMSIIREDESNLDAAIWHMERSFEVQPSNAAVQVELRRLYGLRDGMTPQKIQLTRGALARMSAKSNLYTQAIAELRTALSNDPQRPDLQVVLAEMYAKTGARMEAAETCNSLISKIPYCMVANRILAEILPETERAERAQEYRDRLIELDPYYGQISPVAPTVDQVPDGAVTIERYDLPGESFEASKPTQPEWATALGVNIDEEMDLEEEIPDWLGDEPQELVEVSSFNQVEDLDSEELSSEEEILGGESEAITPKPEEDEQLPDWMTAADQLEDEETVDSQISEPEEAQEEIPDEIEESQPEAEALPDWMSEVDQPEEGEISSGEIPSEPEPELEVASEQFPTDSGEGEEDLEWMGEISASGEIETPDWLREAMEESPEDESQLAKAAGAAAAAGVTAFVTGDEQEQDITAEVSEEISPLAEQGPEADEGFDSVQIEEPADTEAPLEGVITGEGGIAAAAFAAAGLSGGDDEEEAGFAAETESPSEEMLSDSEISTEEELLSADSISASDQDIPDWLKDLGEEQAVEADRSEEPLIQDDLIERDERVSPEVDQVLEIEEIDIGEISSDAEIMPGESLTEARIDAEQLDAEFGDSIPDWLSEVSPAEIPDLALEDVTPDEEFPDIIQAEIPEWLRKMEQQHKAELAAAGATDRIEELEFESEVTELTGEDVPSWLMSAMGTELAKETPTISEVEDIGEILSEEDEQALVEEIAIEEELSQEPEIEAPFAEVEAAEEPLEVEVEEYEPILAEEVEAEPQAEEIGAVPAEGGIGFPELIAAELIADELIEEGDTRPVAVGAQMETAEEEIKLQEPITEEGEIGEGIEPIEAAVEEQDIETELIEEEQIEVVEIEETIAPALAEEAPVSEVDEDAAMAWLESLAAKQGAAEDELLTSPEERLDQPPEWIQEAAVQEEAMEEVEDEEEVDAIAAAALAGIAAGVLADKEHKVEEVGQPEEETPSEWIPEITEEIGEVAELEFEEPPLELEDVETHEPSSLDTAPAMESEVEAAEELIAVPEEELIEEPPPEEIPEEIPAWLSGIDEEEELQVEVPSAEWSPDLLAEEEVIPEVAELPVEKKIDLNAASLSQLEKIPGIGFIHAQRIINYRTESGPFKDLAELEKVPGLNPDMVADLIDHVTVEVVVEAAPPPSSHPDLQDAWNSINEGEIEEAVTKYEQLINRDEHLDEVIRDLQEALGKYPLDASLYQSLGDAYLHSNLLQEALDAYNRAEDLIK